ncbi:unnamed protein product [Auanema sp. JU1783]|nr:unnamed protein product [Auanema sp. JU1783]
MVEPLVRAQLKDKIMLISINRPTKNNAVNHDTACQLIRAFEDFNENKEAKIAILYGQGSNFCAGYDLKDVSEGKIETEKNFLPKYRYMGPTSMKLKKPLIAAIEGYAVAGGLELSLMADIRIASKTSKFGVFCRRVGVPLIDGGTVRLQRIVGQGRALEMILTGRAVEAEEALLWGLVNRVVEKDEALNYSIELAKEIISHPYDCMIADRNSVFYAQENGFEESMINELKSVSVLDKAVRGAIQFVNKELKPPSKL